MKYLLLICLSLHSVTSFAQPDRIVYLDNDMRIVKESKAMYKGHGIMNGASFELRLYTKNEDYHLLTAHFTDATLAVLNGPFISYFKNGNIENSAFYANGKPDGLWQRWDTANMIIDSIWYHNGHADSSVHFDYSSANKLSSIIRSNYDDSTFITIHFDQNATLTTAVRSDTLTKSDNIVAANPDDQVEFPGGDSAMANYFQYQLQMDKYDLLTNATSGSCTIRFTVDKSGRAENIANLYCDNRAFFDAFQLAIRNISWLPATKNGRPVTALKQITASFYPALSELSNKKGIKTYLDRTLGITTPQQATYYGTIVKEDQLIKYILTETFKNNEIFSMHFTDSSLETSNGLFSSLYPNGRLRLQGNFVLGRKNGWWLQWNYDGLVTDSARYDLGNKISETALAYQPDGSLMTMDVFDFNDQTMRRMLFDDNEKTYDQIMKRNIPDKDSLYSTADNEAIFRGGETAWLNYVRPALVKKRSNIFSSGTCVVGFTVDTSGKVSDVKVLTMRGSDLARIVEKVIKNGPDWIPAEVHGIKVMFFLLQPFTINNSYRW